MTTKKQRRAAVEEKRQARIAEDKRLGLEALERSRAQRRQIEIEAESAERSKKTAMALARIDSKKKVGDITVGEFLRQSHTQAPLDSILHDPYTSREIR